MAYKAPDRRVPGSEGFGESFGEFQSFLRGAGLSLPDPTSLAFAAHNVHTQRARAFEENVGLLRFDAEQYAKVAGDVYGQEIRRGEARAAEAAAGFVGSGVTVSGSAEGVVRGLRAEGEREAAAQREQYLIESKRAAKQADIQSLYAGLETAAGEFAAQEVQRSAQLDFLQAFTQHRAAMQQLANRREADAMKVRLAREGSPLSTRTFMTIS